MKLKKRNTNFTRRQWLAIALLYTMGLLIVAIFSLYGSPGATIFIQGCVLELAFALFSNWFQKPGFILYFLYTLVAIIIPVLTALSDITARPVGPVFFGYFIITSLMSLVRFNIPFPKWFILPSYLPDGFKQVDYWIYNRAPLPPSPGYKSAGPSYNSAGLTYEDGSGGKLTIGGKNGITYREPVINHLAFKKDIKGVVVVMDKDSDGHSIRYTLNNKLPLITAKWFNKGFEYELDSDGITLEEAEKVISSMIPDEPDSDSQKEGA